MQDKAREENSLKGIPVRRESWVVSLSFHDAPRQPQAKRKSKIFVPIMKSYFSTHPYFYSLLHNSGAGTLKTSFPLAAGFLFSLYQSRELEENWKRGEGTYSILTSCCSCQYNPLSRWVPVSSYCWPEHFAYHLVPVAHCDKYVHPVYGS